MGVDPTPRRGARPRAALPAGYAPTPSVRPDPSRPPLAVVTGSAARVRRARPVATALLLCTGMAVIALVALAAGPASPATRPVQAAGAARHATSQVADDLEAPPVAGARADLTTPLAAASDAPAAAGASLLPRAAVVVLRGTSRASPVTAPPVASGDRAPAAPAAATAPATAAPPTAAPPRLVPRPAATPAATATPAAAVRAVPGERGLASWYSAPAGTCAHPSLPFGTVLTVTDVATGRSVTCRVDDRGPYAGGRVVDLAPDVFARLAPLAIGVALVRVTW